MKRLVYNAALMAFPCPTCGASAGRCISASGRTTDAHAARVAGISGERLDRAVARLMKEDWRERDAVPFGSERVPGEVYPVLPGDFPFDDDDEDEP